MLVEGDKAPLFSATDRGGTIISLEDFKGKNVVVYFYPKDNTPGCTIEAKGFTAAKKDFEDVNTVVIGFSKDNATSHDKFICKHDLDLILLSDEEKTIQESYGVWRKKKFMGKEFMGTVRSTFLIDKKGKIVKIWDNVKVKGHVKEVLEEAKKLSS